MDPIRFVSGRLRLPVPVVRHVYRLDRRQTNDRWGRLIRSFENRSAVSF